MWLTRQDVKFQLPSNMTMDVVVDRFYIALFSALGQTRALLSNVIINE